MSEATCDYQVGFSQLVLAVACRCLAVNVNHNLKRHDVLMICVSNCLKLPKGPFGHNQQQALTLGLIYLLFPTPKSPQSNFLQDSSTPTYAGGFPGSAAPTMALSGFLSPVTRMNELALSFKISFSQRTVGFVSFPAEITNVPCVKCICHQGGYPKANPRANESRKIVKKARKVEHHLWKRRDSAKSGQKALNLVRIISGLPNEKEAVYGALDKWIAWETEFPLIAVAKALRILRQKREWMRVIQVAKWMLSKGQGTTMGTYDTLLLAFDMDNRVDEADSLWNMILYTHMRSISKRLFSRMISLYDHHNLQDKMIEVFADMEELGVKPDEDTVRRVSHAFKKLGQEEKQKLVLRKYLGRWKYIHFNGERVRVKRQLWNQE